MGRGLATRSHFRFEVIHRSARSAARVCAIHTPHGVIRTPAFVPVATNAALKGVSIRQAEDMGVQLMFCNTYHLLVHPGPDIVVQAGGLHNFMGRRGPLITDSGGFQVFSLGSPDPSAGAEEGELKSRSRFAKAHQGCLLKVTEDGATFRSYRDGTAMHLSPEASVRAQKAFGADIIIPLDELPANSVSPSRLRSSLSRSHRWMKRSLDEHLRDPRDQAMYGVLHGGTDRQLRQESARFLADLPFDGTAVGGSLGATREEMITLMQDVMPMLRVDRPVHLLGIADEESVGRLVPTGVDTFDSCWPTRIARHGTLLTTAGRLQLGRKVFATDFRPVDPAVPALRAATGNATRAYLHHLFKQREPLFVTLASAHNIAWMNWHMSELRAAILRDDI